MMPPPRPRTVGDLSLRAARRRVPLGQPLEGASEDRLRSNFNRINVSEPLPIPSHGDADISAAKRLATVSKPSES